MTTNGFIFDLDGVITDTAEYHYLGWKRLADEEGLSFTREDNEALRGVSRRESLARLLKGKSIDEETAQEWMTRKNTYYQAFLQSVTPADLLDGVADFLLEAKHAGIKIGLASASRNACLVIEKLQIVHLFDVIGDGYSVQNSKPASDLFCWVAGGLGVATKNCVVFEDAEAGVEAALNAGMKCVGIGPQDRVGAAHTVYAALHKANFQDIVQLLA